MLIRTRVQRMYVYTYIHINIRGCVCFLQYLMIRISYRTYFSVQTIMDDTR